MSISTVAITGQIRLPDNTVPEYGDVVFTPNSYAAVGADAVVAHPVTVPVTPTTGAINAQLWPASGPWSGLRYRVTVVEYRDATKQDEIDRHDLGTISVQGASDIGSLLPVLVPALRNQVITIRQGDSFNVVAVNVDRYGVPIATGAVSAKMRHTGTGQVTNITVTTLPDPSMVELSLSPSVTAGLPIGEYEWNVRYSGARVQSTEYGRIIVQRGLA